MPEKVRFTLRGEAPRNPHQHSSGLRALVLGWIAATQPGIAVSFHEAGAPKPYSIGPMAAIASSECCFEIAILADWLSAVLLEGSANPGDPILLGQQRYQLASSPATVMKADWNDLIGRPARRPWRLGLLTPTAHHASAKPRRVVVAPDPALYFGSWLGRWKSCSGLPTPESIDSAIRESLVVSAFKGGTSMERLDEARPFIGFMGEVAFDIAPNAGVDRAAEDFLGTLVRFAEFSGTGVETMRGMGQTRHLSSRKAETYG